MNCRYCNHYLENEFVNFNNSPLANSFLTDEQLQTPETYLTLKLYVCSKCFLVQADNNKKAKEIFNPEYAYFSSYSPSYLAHAKAFSEQMANRFEYNEKSLVIEIDSNDGYLLQYFREKNIPVLGIEPIKNTANVAALKGIPTISEYFSASFAQKLQSIRQKADLLISNKFLTHVSDIKDFVEGLKIALRKNGVITMEFPHLLKLIEENRFDTINHRECYYLSFTTIQCIFSKHSLEIFDVEELPTHSSFLRIYAKHKKDKTKEISTRVQVLLEREEKAGIKTISYYKNFQFKIDQVKHAFLNFLVNQKKEGKKIVAYGASTKGNTFLNYCGIVDSDLIHFIVDPSPHKQNKYLPGSHLPIYNEAKIEELKPDYIIILSYNHTNEVIQQLKYARDWDCQFVIFIPTMQILSEPPISIQQHQLI